MFLCFCYTYSKLSKRDENGSVELAVVDLYCLL